METLCGKAFSKSTVSDACKELDRQVEAFRNRPINGRYPFMTVDATYFNFKVRENHRIISKALMIAYGINEEGKQREILGFASYEKESKETWKAFLMKAWVKRFADGRVRRTRGYSICAGSSVSWGCMAAVPIPFFKKYF